MACHIQLLLQLLLTVRVIVNGITVTAVLLLSLVLTLAVAVSAVEAPHVALLLSSATEVAVEMQLLIVVAVVPEGLAMIVETVMAVTMLAGTMMTVTAVIIDATVVAVMAVTDGSAMIVERDHVDDTPHRVYIHCVAVVALVTSTLLQLHCTCIYTESQSVPLWLSAHTTPHVQYAHIYAITITVFASLNFIRKSEF